MQLEQFTPVERSDGDRVQIRDLVDRVLLVRVTERREGIVTEFSPDGAAALIVDLVDLDDPAGPATYRDVLWMNKTVVDHLTPWVGKAGTVITPTWQQGKSGRKYIALPEPTPEQFGRGAAYVGQHPNPFPDDETAEATPAPAQSPAPNSSALVASVDGIDPAAQELINRLTNSK